MQAFLISWKTTILGVVNVVIGVYLIKNGEAAIGTIALTQGLGLIAAKDANVTSEDAGLKVPVLSGIESVVNSQIK